MRTKDIQVANVRIAGFSIGAKQPPLLIAGPCVLEDIETALSIGSFMTQAAGDYGFSYLFKASFDKANRTSIRSYRGPGLTEGLEMLSAIKEELNVAVISDIHTPEQAEAAATVLDCIQIPAFLCRQTDILRAAARTRLPINIKKGQFMAPWDMRHAVAKIKESGNDHVILTERGTCFGYNNLVVDMRSLSIMKRIGTPVVFDATHSVQLPGGGDGCSSGQREFVPTLAMAAMAAGVDGIFLEVHPNPDKALCDGPNSLSLEAAADLLKVLSRIRQAVEIDD
ncbi:MAG: 3-deoxy-8-phosphooctulonate synthase [Deltaproteobacteria bacterium]|nr:3-deoxy-8-phosphooctulonate synthase [Deltaproteobacteria bacterium]MBW1719030.1 3-deoxy-8-phosphooctulonate synthase [Deltaproteobacteria bacterium]MBW1932450.1 3-deoxy-8-phosphooctulonate synthase [Deltaproteobacteria bacterium]MBW1937794.1 3-deoxy-8-phosphooctulonate synthase [Deltaproteobacteria bacterium]MBW1963929.1 3-deoxy-8-phosphooctulonate synthase [Deltaproteobacteria bacterium]